jgi:hypothetical protein
MPYADPCPQFTTKPFRLTFRVVSDVCLHDDCVAMSKRMWWFLAPGHRDLWVALGHTPVTPTCSAQRWLEHRTHRELTNRCAALGVPLRVIDADPQRVGELQLIAVQAMSADQRPELIGRRPAARVAAVRDALLDDANTARHTITLP